MWGKTTTTTIKRTTLYAMCASTLKIFEYVLKQEIFVGNFHHNVYVKDSSFLFSQFLETTEAALELHSYMQQ